MLLSHSFLNDVSIDRYAMMTLTPKSYLETRPYIHTLDIQPSLSRDPRPLADVYAR